MALLQDLIRQINDPTLRDRILQETVELIVQECQQQGIPTMTPDEIAKLKGLTGE